MKEPQLLQCLSASLVSPGQCALCCICECMCGCLADTQREQRHLANTQHHTTQTVEPLSHLSPTHCCHQASLSLSSLTNTRHCQPNPAHSQAWLPSMQHTCSNTCTSVSSLWASDSLTTAADPGSLDARTPVHRLVVTGDASACDAATQDATPAAGIC